MAFSWAFGLCSPFSLLDRHGAFVFDSVSYSELRLGDHTTIDFGNSFLTFFSFAFWKLEFIAILQSWGPDGGLNFVQAVSIWRTKTAAEGVFGQSHTIHEIRRHHRQKPTGSGFFGNGITIYHLWSKHRRRSGSRLTEITIRRLNEDFIVHSFLQTCISIALI